MALLGFAPVQSPFTGQQTLREYEYDFSRAGLGTVAFHELFRCASGVMAFLMLCRVTLNAAAGAGATASICGDSPLPPSTPLIAATGFANLLAGRLWYGATNNSAVDISTPLIAGYAVGSVGLNILVNPFSAGKIRMLLGISCISPGGAISVHSNLTPVT